MSSVGGCKRSVRLFLWITREVPFMRILYRKHSSPFTMFNRRVKTNIFYVFPFLLILAPCILSHILPSLHGISPLSHLGFFLLCTSIPFLGCDYGFRVFVVAIAMLLLCIKVHPVLFFTKRFSSLNLYLVLSCTTAFCSLPYFSLLLFVLSFFSVFILSLLLYVSAPER